MIDLGPGSAIEYRRYLSGAMPDVPAGPGEVLGAVDVPAWWPDCMSDDLYLSWLAADQALPSRQRAGVPCMDCPVTFAHVASDSGQCNRNG
jgi:hypothetical protein